METINIGILGLGTVGSGIISILNNNADSIEQKLGKKIVVKKVLVKNINKKRDIDIDNSKLTTNADEIINDKDISVIVEVMGGTSPTKEYITSAIKNGKHVVSANKELIAKEGQEIFALCRENNVQFFFEASVAGGIPIISAIEKSLTSNKIEELSGIINGTTNYILTKMTKEGLAFDDVLKEAQDAGYAEADPTSDIEGYDAAYKLAILSTLSFNTKVDIKSIHVEGITKISPEDISFGKEFGYVLKLLGIAKRVENNLELRVHPTFISESHPLASVNDTFNAILIKGNAVGDLMFYGRGAGDLPTGSAVVADILSVIENMIADKYVSRDFEDSVLNILPSESFKAKYFIRLNVTDKPGVMAQIATIFGGNNVSISSVIQKAKGQKVVPLVFITHQVLEKNIQNSLEQIKELSEVEAICNVIRVEDERR